MTSRSHNQDTRDFNKFHHPVFYALHETQGLSCIYLMKNAGLHIIQVNVSGVNGAKQQQQQQPRMHTLPAAVAPVGIGLI